MAGDKQDTRIGKKNQEHKFWIKFESKQAKRALIQQLVTIIWM